MFGGHRCRSLREAAVFRKVSFHRFRGMIEHRVILVGFERSDHTVDSLDEELGRLGR